MTPTAIQRAIAHAAPGPARFSVIHQFDHIGDIQATAARPDGPRSIALLTPSGWTDYDPYDLRPGD